MSFEVSAAAYARFMGRYSEPLAREFADFAEIRRGQRVLDVGCGPGALTAQLVDELGASAVAAVDPSQSFVAAAAQRFPEVDVQLGTAERLPYADDAFDASLAQLVVHFMGDPVAGLTQMRRVVRPGGTVAACVWDHAGAGGPLSSFWRAVHDLDPEAPGEAELAGAREGQLSRPVRRSGPARHRSGEGHRHGHVPVVHRVVGAVPVGRRPSRCVRRRPRRSTAGAAEAALPELLPAPPFSVDASAWSVRARK